MKFAQLISRLYFEPLLIEPTVRMSLERAFHAHINSPRVDDYDDDEASTPSDRVSRIYSQKGSLAIISIDGVIGKHLSLMDMMCYGGVDLADVEHALAKAENDPSVSKVLLNINSPGGSVTGVPETGAAVARLAAQKPVVAFTDSLCASAAYWIASQASEIVATTSAQVGSIGVYLALLDESRALEMDGYKVELIKAGKFKAAGASFKPLSDDEREMFQQRVDSTYAQFTAAVRAGRGDIDDSTMQGQTFDAADAIKLGLVDLMASNIDEVAGQMKTVG